MILFVAKCTQEEAIPMMEEEAEEAPLITEAEVPMRSVTQEAAIHQPTTTQGI